MVNSAKLIKDEDGYVIATFEQVNNYELSTDGVIREAVTWDGDTGDPIDTNFFARTNVKWDGCSHINFNGEKYIDTQLGEGNRSYYHLCGVESYLNFMRLLVFAYELMVEHVGYENVLEKEEYEELKQLGLLKGYSIVFE